MISRAKETEVVRDGRDELIFHLLPDGSFPRPRKLILYWYATSFPPPLCATEF